MRTAVKVFVLAVAVASLVALYALWWSDGAVVPAYITAAVFFSTLGLLAQALEHRLASGASGSIAFIPFLATAALAPSWTSCASVAIAVVVAELFGRRPAIKVLFNISQYLLASALAILTYRLMGGRPMIEPDSGSLQGYIALVALFAVFMVVNWASVSTVVALNDRRHVFKVWSENTLSSITYDVLSFLLLYLFVWVYSNFGVRGAMALALPILGVRQLYKTNWLLEQTNQDLLQLMVAAIEARDPYTSGHSRRVSHYSKLIARAIGLTGRAVDRVGVAALLHDVGKIHEAFAPLLRKDGPLTQEERALMETHSDKSAELVSTVSQLKDVVAPIRHHHENWDGTGYPAGLAGEEIPLAARIIMVADTIDAMTTDRPYRAALGPEDVKAELARWSGKQFDPKLCDMLLSSTLFLQIFDRSKSPPHAIRISDHIKSRKASA